MDKPKIILEVPATASFPIWPDLYRRELETQYRSQGLAKSQAKVAAQQHIALLRDVQFRRRPAQDCQSET